MVVGDLEIIDGDRLGEKFAGVADHDGRAGGGGGGRGCKLHFALSRMIRLGRRKPVNGLDNAASGGSRNPV